MTLDEFIAAVASTIRAKLAQQVADGQLPQPAAGNPTAADIAAGVWSPDAYAAADALLDAVLPGHVWQPIRDTLIAGPKHDLAKAVTVENVHAAWQAVSGDPTIQHPLNPLIKAWLYRPPNVTPNLDFDRNRIIPAKIAMYQPHAASSRMIGRFSPAAHAPPDGQGFLPGFGEEVVTPALPLVLYELGVNDPQNPGAGAPVALRIFVESILAMPLGQQCAELSIPARTMIARLYPHRPPTAKEWDAAIETARAALASPEAGIQWNGKRQWAVWLHTIPTTLDGDIGIRVNLPEGSDTGPQVSKRLHLYGPKQGRHYRALLNLAYWWHEPGRTLIPAGKGKSHWLQVDDPKRYRKLSDAEIVNIVFPKSASKRRRNLLSRAARTIADLRDDGELRIVAGKLLPPLKTAPPAPR